VELTPHCGEPFSVVRISSAVLENFDWISWIRSCDGLPVKKRIVIQTSVKIARREKELRGWIHLDGDREAPPPILNGLFCVIEVVSRDTTGCRYEGSEGARSSEQEENDRA
jgi:hypothetical protein